MSTTLPFPQGGASNGAPPPGPATPLPGGTEVAHLVIDRVLNEGPHNIVYLAHDSLSEDGNAIALMEYFPRALALRQPDGTVRARQAGDAIALSVAREAFVQDAVALQQIEHPNLVRVLGSLQAHRTVYRAMQYVEGPTLERQVLGREGPAQVGEVVRLLDALLEALDALHRAGVIHGNVRPDQILLAGGRIDRPVLLGMGSAAAEIAGHQAGPWAAPEQSAASRHDRINSATDLYMLAATAWFAATGDEPPALRDRLAQPRAWDPREAMAELTEGPGDSPGTKARLARSLAAALELLPSSRPQRVDDLRGLLHPSTARPSFETSGTAPLWVGQVPDREAQWKVVEATARSAAPPHPPAAKPGGLESVPARPVPRPSTTHPAPQSAQLSPAIPPRPLPMAPVPPKDGQPVDKHPQRKSSAAEPARSSRTERWALLAGLATGAVLAAAAWFLLKPQPPLRFVVASPAASGTSLAEQPRGLEANAGGRVVAPPEGSTMGLGSPPPPHAVPSLAAAPFVSVAPTAGYRTVPAGAGTTMRSDTRAIASRGSRGPRDAASRPMTASPIASIELCSNVSGFSFISCLQEECVKQINRSHPRCVQWRRSNEGTR